MGWVCLAVAIAADTAATGLAAASLAARLAMDLVGGPYRGHGRGAWRGMPMASTAEISAGTSVARVAEAPWPTVTYGPCRGMRRSMSLQSQIMRIPAVRDDPTSAADHFITGDILHASRRRSRGVCVPKRRSFWVVIGLVAELVEYVWCVVCLVFSLRHPRRR